MNVTAEVVKDLLPLFVAGEASADTKALVEEFLRADPQLAALAAALREQEDRPPQLHAAPPGAERAALSTTRSLLRRRSWLLSFALMFTGLPLSFSFDSGGMRFLLLRDAPMFALVSWVVAAGLWVAFAQVARRLRVTGL
jgi:anti-sigma factor RsiW